jgi:two-component system, sensor histidine kinase and response regulator
MDGEEAMSAEHLEDAEEAPRPEEAVDPDERHRQTVSVAMVDDEEPLCMAVERILTKYAIHVPDVGVDASYGFTYYTTAEQLLEAVEKGQAFDLLLLDLKLPGMSGLDLLTELSTRNQGILTIMITAYATFETAVQATKLGAYDFLPKPFSPDELRYAVRKATGQLILSKEARRLAEEKRQVRFNFISVLAHELKAPLNAIEGYLKILRTDEPLDRAHMIDRSLLRLDGMKKLIFDLLDLTRIESGQKQRTIASFDIRPVAQAAAELFVGEAAERGITITVDPGEPVVVTCDASEIGIILNNLISNAVKYNRENGSVTVALARTDREVRITVADTGIGLAPEESAKLFREFVRIKNDDTIKVIGSGLGLSTVRKLAQLYGGDATVKSSKGEGSVFTVTLSDAGTEARTAASETPGAWEQPGSFGQARAGDRRRG